MDFRKIKALIIAISIFLTLTFFYINSKTADMDHHNDVVEKFHQLKHVSALVTQDLISLRLVMLPSFDALKKNMNWKKSILDSLESGPSAIYRKGNGEMDHLFDKYRELIAKRETLIDDFKSHTAQLNNSLHYLPTAIEQLKSNTGDRALQQNLEALLRDILIYNVDSSAALKKRIQSRITAIKKHPFMKTEASTGMLLHPEIIMDKKDLVDVQLTQLVAMPINDHSEELFDVYNLGYTRQLDRSNTYRYLLYLSCLALFMYALYMFLRLRHSALQLHNANVMLEQRVSERTSELEETVTSLKQTQSKLLQSEKMSAVGQLAAGVAHEINNPLGVILGFAQASVRRLQPGDPLEQALKSIEREALRCKNLVQDLLTFSRTNKTDRLPMDINLAIDGALTLVRTQAKTRGMSIDVDLKPGLPRVLADKNKLQQVVINLASNAMDAMEKGGQITIKTELIEGRQSWVVLKIADNGHGIPMEVLPRIFEPFFTTKPVGKGTGLGLSLAYETVKAHSGLLDVTSRPGLTEFTIKLPVQTGHETENRTQAA